jgi:hypothetical protein
LAIELNLFKTLPLYSVFILLANHTTENSAKPPQRRSSRLDKYKQLPSLYYISSLLGTRPSQGMHYF